MVAPAFNGRFKKGLVSENAKSLDIPIEFFSETVTITFAQAAAGTVIPIVPAARVGSNRRFRILGYRLIVTGTTAWASGTSVILRDTAGNALITAATAALGASAVIENLVANVTYSAQMRTGNGTPSADGVGLELVGSGAFSAGSDISLMVYGIIQ